MRIAVTTTVKPPYKLLMHMALFSRSWNRNCCSTYFLAVTLSHSGDNSPSRYLRQSTITFFAINLSLLCRHDVNDTGGLSSHMYVPYKHKDVHALCICIGILKFAYRQSVVMRPRNDWMGMFLCLSGGTFLHLWEKIKRAHDTERSLGLRISLHWDS